MADVLSITVDADGIAIATMDSPGRSMNVLDADVLQELSEIIDSTTKDEKIKGVVITFIDVSEIKTAERQFKALGTYLDSISAAIR